MIKIIFLALPMSFFWAGIMSFVPSVIYLILNPIRSNKAEKSQGEGIFLIKAEVQLNKEKHRRVRGVRTIYLICVLFFFIVYIYNQISRGHTSIVPFDILSALSVVFFLSSFVAYLPFAGYLFIKKPWSFDEEGIILTRIFILYGFCILFFSLIYIYSWLGARGLLLEAKEMFLTILSLFLGATGIAYLPILFYIFTAISGFKRALGPRPSTIFIIYSVSFLIFSFIYIFGWVGKV